MRAVARCTAYGCKVDADEDSVGGDDSGHLRGDVELRAQGEDREWGYPVSQDVLRFGWKKSG